MNLSCVLPTIWNVEVKHKMDQHNLHEFLVMTMDVEVLLGMTFDGSGKFHMILHIPGHQTYPLANAFMCTIPGWGSCNISITLLLPLGGTTLM